MSLFGPPNIDKMKSKGDVTGLIKALEYKDSSVRKSSAEALGELIKDHKLAISDCIIAVGKAGPAGVYALECIAKGGSSYDSGFESYAIQIIEILHSIGNQEAIRVLGSIATSIFPSHEYRISFAAAKSLTDLDRQEANKALIHILHQKENFYINSTVEAIRLLSQFNDETIFDEFIIALGDCRKDVNQAAANALDQIGDKQLLDLKAKINSILQGNLEDASDLRDSRVVGAMIKTLQTANIVSAYSDPFNEYRKYCILRAHAAGAALRIMGDKTALNTHLHALRTLEYEDLREAIALLGCIGDKDATKSLLDFMEEKRYQNYLRDAIDALGEIGDETAIPKLREISINDPWNYYPDVITALLQMGEPGIVALSDIIQLKSEESFAGLLKLIGETTITDSGTLKQFSQILRNKYEGYPNLKKSLHDQAEKEEVNGWGSIYQLSLVGDFSILPLLKVRRDELREGVLNDSDTSHGGTTGWQKYGDFFRAVDYMEKQNQELNG